jgi:hypothetical protein
VKCKTSGELGCVNLVDKGAYSRTSFRVNNVDGADKEYDIGRQAIRGQLYVHRPKLY